MQKVMNIRVGKKGSLGPWSRVIVYGSKLFLCQNDSPIGRSFWHKDSLLQYAMTLLQGPKDPVLPTLHCIYFCSFGLQALSNFTTVIVLKLMKVTMTYIQVRLFSKKKLALFKTPPILTRQTLIKKKNFVCFSS